MPATPPESRTVKPATSLSRDGGIDVFGLTHPGKARPTNQDHFLIASWHKALHVWGTSLPHPDQLEVPSARLAAFALVADGVGGGLGGEEASRAAAEAVATYTTQTMRCYYAMDPGQEGEFLQALQEAATAAHQRVVAITQAHPELTGMATTLTVTISVWPWLYVLHVGDSRCYRLRGTMLERLTRDQTLAEALVEQGLLSASRAEHSPLAHVLSSAIGGEAHPMVGRFDAAPEDVILLCTDGLTKHVPEERIRHHLLFMTSAEQVCRDLVDEALAGGGSDNVTVVVGRAPPRAKPVTPAVPS